MAVAELLTGFGSVVVLVALAVFVIVEPLATLAPTLTTSVKVCPARAARVVRVQLTVPVAPTAGVVQTKVALYPWLSETKRVLHSFPTRRSSDLASDGPLFVMLIE